MSAWPYVARCRCGWVSAEYVNNSEARFALQLHKLWSHILFFWKEVADV